jgi:prepilin peptidase CpaA
VALWLMGAGGAGDAKMMAAVGAWLGPYQAIVAVLAVALCGGVLSLAYALAQRRAGHAMINVLWMLASVRYLAAGPGRLRQRQAVVPPTAVSQKVPYGLAICSGLVAGAAWVWLWPK